MVCCGSRCVDIQNDSNNCGGCNKKCTLEIEPVCRNGICMCGEQSCSGEIENYCCSNACYNLLTDTMNCGYCSHV